MEWYCKETRGLRALSAPLWKEPEKALRVLRGVDVRGHEKWLPAKFPALAELGLRGRPRASLVPRGCTALSLTYHVRYSAACICKYHPQSCKGFLL